jgi:putative transport protein
MLESLTGVLQESPLLALFLVVGLGYILGEISFFGFRLGVAGVLFAGLIVSAVLPGTVAIPELLGTFGLILFVYAMGLQSGPAFFRGFGQQGLRYSLLAIGALVVGAIAQFGVAAWLDLSSERSAGLYTGAITNTPALAAVLEVARNSLAAETYSIAYPFGVVGVLLCFHLARLLWKPQMQSGSVENVIHTRNFLVRNPGIVGKTLAELDTFYPNSPFRISRVQTGGSAQVAAPDTQLQEGDVVVVVGDEDGLRRAQAIFGGTSETSLESDRSNIDYRRMTVSNKSVAGKRIQDLRFPEGLHCSITRVRRADEDFVPTGSTRLSYGDRIRVVARRDQLGKLAEFFGDSIRGTAEMDFASVGIGLVLGVLVGMIPITFGDLGTFHLGFAGGPLLVALVLGYLEHTGPINWTIPVSANLTLRQVGLLLFLATVGLRSGPGFVATFQTHGLALVLGGAVVTLSIVLPAMIVGYKVMKIPFDELLGVISGIQTQPAAVAFASHMTKSDRTEVGYASAYPSAMIAKVLLAQFLYAIGTSGGPATP